MSGEISALCKICTTINDCKRAFGKYWLYKSHGGVGCSFPFAGWNRGKPKPLPKMPRRKPRQVDLI